MVEEKPLSEEEFNKNLLKLDKKLNKEIKKKSNSSKFFRGIILKTTVFLFILLFFALGLVELPSYLYPVPANTTRTFVFDSCNIANTFPCDFILKGQSGTLLLETGNYKLDKIQFPICNGSLTYQKNNITIEGCKFSPFSNNREILITVEDPYTGLKFPYRGKIVKAVEITNIRSLILKYFGV